MALHKWNAQSQAGGVTQADLMVKLLENMSVFLKYREKYYKIAARTKLIRWARIMKITTSHLPGQTEEYKTWWANIREKTLRYECMITRQSV